MPNRPWCNQHNAHPNDCFELHYPNSVRKHDGPTEDEVIQEAIREHIRRQEESIRREREKMDRSVVDARKRFEDKRRKGA